MPGREPCDVWNTKPISIALALNEQSAMDALSPSHTCQRQRRLFSTERSSILRSAQKTVLDLILRESHADAPYVDMGLHSMPGHCGDQCVPLLQ